MMDVRSVSLLLMGLVFKSVFLVAQPAGPAAVPEVAFMAMHPGGSLAALSYSDRSEVLLLDLDTGLPRQRLQWEGPPIAFLAFDRARERLVGATSGSVLIWRLSDFRLEAEVPLAVRPQGAEAAGRTTYAYDPDRQLLYRSYGSDLYCYSLRRKGLAKTLTNAKVPADSTARGAQLAQAPDRKVLWVLDPNKEQLRCIELERFRETARLDLPGAVAFAVENQRLAVLRRPPDSSAYVVDLFDAALEATASFSIDRPLPAEEQLRLAFTGVDKLSVSAHHSVIDLWLDGRQPSVFDFDLPYEELYFLLDGRLALRQGLTLRILDAWGRVASLHGLWAGTQPLYDARSGRRYQLEDAGIWEAGGRQLLAFDEGEGPVLTAAVSGEVLALGMGDGRILLYDLKAGERMRAFQAMQGPVNRLALDVPSHRIVAIGAPSGEAILLNALTGRRLTALPAGNSAIQSMALDQERVFLGDAAGTIRSYGLDDGRPLGAAQVQNGPVTALATHPAGRHLLVGGPRGILACTRPALQPDRHFWGHDNAVRHLAVEPDGRRFISTAGDNAVRVWDFHDGRLLHHLQPSGFAPRLAFPATANSEVAVTDERGSWSIEPLVQSSGPSDWSRMATRAVGSLPAIRPALSPDGQLLVRAGGARPGIGLWRAIGGQVRQWMPPGGLQVATMAFLDDSVTLLLAGDRSFQYWDARTGTLLRTVNYRASGLRLGGLCVDRQRARLWAFQQQSDQVLLFDSRSGQLLSDFHIQEFIGEGPVELLDMVISDDAGTLALVTDRGIVVYDTELNRPVSLVEHPVLAGAGPGKLFISPHGRMLAGVSPGREEIVVYDLYQESVLFRGPGRTAIFLDAYRMVMLREEEAGSTFLDLWNYLNGAPMGAFEIESRSKPTFLSYAPAARRLVTAAADGSFLVWKDAYRAAGPGTPPEYRFVQALPLPPGERGAAAISFSIGEHLEFRFPVEEEAPLVDEPSPMGHWPTPYRQNVQE